LKAGYFITYGYVGNDIGYMHIEGFADLAKGYMEPMDTVIDYFKDAKAMIMDMRGGYGGQDVAAQYVAGRFADKSRPYQISKVRNGKKRTDFTEPYTWYVKPEGEKQFLKPVIILTHRATLSARETFCLAMKVLPNVTFMGDTTSGGFSDAFYRELPNGWGYQVGVGDWRNANGLSHEGIGLIPDTIVLNKKSDLLKGKDHVLETAIAKLENQ